MGRHVVGNRLAEGTAVEHIRTLRGDQLEACGKLLHDDDVTG